MYSFRSHGGGVGGWKYLHPNMGTPPPASPAAAPRPRAGPARGRGEMGRPGAPGGRGDLGDLGTRGGGSRRCGRECRMGRGVAMAPFGVLPMFPG